MTFGVPGGAELERQTPRPRCGIRDDHSADVGRGEKLFWDVGRQQIPQPRCGIRDHHGAAGGEARNLLFGPTSPKAEKQIPRALRYSG